MTREELYKIAKHYAQDELKDSHSAVEDVVAAAFIDGVNYADTHTPHWISVEDELPPRWETNPNVSDTVITYGFLGDTHPVVELNHYHFGDGRWFYSQATHWTPFEHPKKGGEE